MQLNQSASTNSYTASDGTQLDPTAVTLAKAIRQKEVGLAPGANPTTADYSLMGDNNTSEGIAQWSNGKTQLQPGQIPANFKSDAVTYGLNPNDFSPTNQDKVLYARIEGELKAGLAPSEIVAKQNGAKIVNGKYVAINPQYASDVAKNYTQIASQGQSQGQVEGATTSQGQPSTQSLSQVPGQIAGAAIPNVNDIGSQLSSNIANRFQQGATGVGLLGSAYQSGVTGNTGGAATQGASGALQTAGAIAGGIGDIINAGIQFVPGVQTLEKTIGSALGSVAQTPEGQKVVQGISNWSQAHPEISGDIGAAINVGSLVPMLKGLSLLSGGVTDAATNALKGDISDAAATEIKGAVGTKAVAAVTSSEKRGLDPIGYITSDPQNLPTIIQNAIGKYIYDGEKGASNIQASLSQDEEALQNKLSQGIQKNIGVDLNDVRQQMLKDVVSDFPVSAKGGQAITAVNKFIDNVLPTTGGRNVVDINELNGLKRSISGINWTDIGTETGEIKASMYRSLMTQVEKYAAKAGVSGVHELNQVMGEKIGALDILKSITGKTVKAGAKRGIAREIAADIGSATGETLGNITGLPFAGALGGRALGRSILAGGGEPVTALTRLAATPAKQRIISGLTRLGTTQALQGAARQ